MDVHPKARTLGRLIADKRGDVTQLAFAATHGFSQGSLSQWERGLAVPSLASLMRLRQAFGLTPAEFASWVELAGEANATSKASA